MGKCVDETHIRAGIHEKWDFLNGHLILNEGTMREEVSKGPEATGVENMRLGQVQGLQGLSYPRQGDYVNDAFAFLLSSLSNRKQETIHISVVSISDNKYVPFDMFSSITLAMS